MDNLSANAWVDHTFGTLLSSYRSASARLALFMPDSLTTLPLPVFPPCSVLHSLGLEYSHDVRAVKYLTVELDEPAVLGLENMHELLSAFLLDPDLNTRSDFDAHELF